MGKHCNKTGDSTGLLSEDGKKVLTKNPKEGLLGKRFEAHQVLFNLQS